MVTGGKGQLQPAVGGTRPQLDDGIDGGGGEAQLLQVGEGDEGADGREGLVETAKEAMDLSQMTGFTVVAEKLNVFR